MTPRRRAANQQPNTSAATAPSKAPAPDRSDTSQDLEHAWKLLAMVNEWLRHAEGKLGAALATVGVIGGVLFSLTHGLDRHDVALDALCATCGLADAIAGLCAIAGLRPRLRANRPGEPNPLYFQDIASSFPGTGTDYSAALHGVTDDRAALLHHLGQQIHAVSSVAQAKYRWADRATTALLLALVSLAMVATAVTLHP
jgi:hypothetical protein